MNRRFSRKDLEQVKIVPTNDYASKRQTANLFKLTPESHKFLLIPSTVSGYEAKFLIRAFSNREVHLQQITDASEDFIVVKMDFNAAELTNTNLTRLAISQ